MGDEKKTPAVWQIAAGDPSRPYSDVFLKYGVALIGPGSPGRWEPGRGDADFEGGPVRQLASEVEVGDIFVLREGVSKICAIGIVGSEYQYLRQFDDVRGCDLQQARRVRWFQPPRVYDFGRPVFGAQARRFSRVWVPEVLDYAKTFLNSPPSDWRTAPLPELPAEEPSLVEVPEYLKDLVAAVADLVPLMWNREKFPELPKEDEMVAHFVVPFFEALGWPPERIAIKWRNIDVALFKDLPRTPENCELVVEAKRLGQGLEYAVEQAKGYVDALGVPRDVMVTDGIRYHVYSCQRNFEPGEFADLSYLKQGAQSLFSRLKKP